ncbi:cache domain-containing sensor histidine kinase [Paenibacillus cremeus]|uniref:Sensor histidine kinase n=1 Tax=Paenibacillus cremeus TaxID=2163881 RepID=A0A559KF47_9BACL|nr:sensor histidine kinase [Paenibacillus cremeus]TVY10754.1 sensor histidine kinase [Paenibacillus cremeus]
MFNPFRRYRIDYVLFISFAVFIALLVTVISGVSYYISARDQADSTSFYQQGMLGELNKQLALQLRAVEQTSLALSQNSAFLSYLDLKGDYYTRNRARIDLSQNYLSPLVNSSPFILSMEVYMDEPTQVDPLSDVQFLPRDYLMGQSWYPSAQKSDFLWLGQRVANSSQGPQQVLSFVRHISSNANPDLGYLVINVKQKTLQTLLSEDKASPSRMLIDGGGRLMLSTKQVPDPEELESLTDDLQGELGHRHIRLSPSAAYDEKDILMVWSKSFQEGWVLVELTPWRDITRGSIQLAKTLVIVGIAALLVTLFITLSLSRNFTAPIRQLVQLMGMYSVGRQVNDFPDTYRNEFGSLFGGYRKMIERIEELYVSLERQHQAQKEAEIKALQAMINPHFLYNTLDQLNWMAIEAGQDRISHVLELMGRMFRIGLSGGESFIPLYDELKHTECYLQIQQLKWGEGLTYRIEMDEGLGELLIPKLTLQPFVENAVIHGFHGRLTGEVTISITSVDEGIMCRIADNGVGIPQDWNKRKKRKTGGYGIRNVIERVEAYFGSPYGVELRQIPEGGTEALIYIPMKKQELGGD